MLLTDPNAVEAIAELLGAKVERAPFQMPQGESSSAPVYHLRMRSDELGCELLLTVWPSQSRVDVRAGKSYWVLKEITSVELYPGTEVLFRREEPAAFLFVSVKGRVALVA